MKYTILIVIALLCSWEGDSQNLRYKQFTLDDDIPSNHIHKTQVDELGYIWIETKEGISRLDGTEIQHLDWMDIPVIEDLDSISIPISFSDNRLYGSNNGEIFAVEMPCVHHLSREITWTKNGVFIHHINTLNESELIVVAEDSCFTLNFSAKDSLFYKANSSSSLSLPSKDKPLSFQLGNYSDQEAIINIPEKGVFKISTSANKTVQYDSISSEIISNGIGIQSISSNEGMWFIKDHTLMKWGEEFNALTYDLPTDLPTIKYIRSNGYHVYFSDGLQLFMYDLTSNTLHEISSAININAPIEHLELDHEDNLWVSTAGDGLYCIYHSLFTGYNIGILGNTSVNHLYKTTSLGLLAGTDDGLYLISSGWSKIPLNPGNQSTKVFCIGEDDNDVIYASTDQGIFSITQGNPKRCIPNEVAVSSFLIDDSGSLSFSRDGFLLAYKNCEEKPKAWPTTAKRSTILVQDDSSRVWMGTNDGLLVYQQGTLEPKKISLEEGIAHAKINDMHLGLKNKLYVGTDGGLSIIDVNTFAIQNFTNLPSLKCRKIAVGKRGDIWVYSPDGIFNFSPSNEENTRKLGIPVDGVNCLKLDEREKLWIGTPRGLLSYDTQNMLQESEAPYLFWNNIELDNEELNVVANEITLTPNSNLKVNYGSVSHRDARLVSYQYRLNASDKWQNTKNRDLSFAKLSAGDYNLQIRVQKPNSPWSKPLELNFEVQPVFWQKPIFLALTGLASFLVMGLIFLRIRAREKKRIETKRRFAELELKALQSQMNPHFIFNTLNAIQHSILKGNPANASKTLNSFATLMRLFLESSTSKYIPLADEVKMLQHYCELTQFCYEGKFNYSIKVDPKIDLDDTEIPSMLIQPHVENAIKHGLLPNKGVGLLDLDFSLDKKKLVCSIKDDGIGREKAMENKKNSNQVHPSKGNTLTMERAKVLNAIYRSKIKIKITDLKGRRGNALGTDVKIIIPIG